MTAVYGDCIHDRVRGLRGEAMMGFAEGYCMGFHHMGIQQDYTTGLLVAT